jgi:peroxiredoxin Q/BCP
LVQLQAGLTKVEATGTQIVGISYDPVPVLQAFASKKNIRFPLLSDAESKTIQAYGVLNAEVKKAPYQGIPFPGTFVIDRDGKIRAKLFHEGYRERHSVEDLVKAAEAVK